MYPSRLWMKSFLILIPLFFGILSDLEATTLSIILLFCSCNLQCLMREIQIIVGKYLIFFFVFHFHEIIVFQNANDHISEQLKKQTLLASSVLGRAIVKQIHAV